MGSFNVAVAVAEVEAVGVGAFDLGADADGRDGLFASPLLDGFAEALADAGAARGVVDDEAADENRGGIRQMAFDGSVDPSNQAIVEDGGDNVVVRICGKGFDAAAEFVGRDGIAELRTEVGGGRRVVGG